MKKYLQSFNLVRAMPFLYLYGVYSVVMLVKRQQWTIQGK
jgi:hypothetical protein